MRGAVPRGTRADDLRRALRPGLLVFLGASVRRSKRELADSATSTVRFRELLLNLRARGAGGFVDTGPGHTMAGLAHKTLENVQTLTVVDLEQGLSRGASGRLTSPSPATHE